MIGLALAIILALVNTSFMNASWEGAFLLSMKFLFIWYCFFGTIGIAFMYGFSQIMRRLPWVVKKSDLPPKKKQLLEVQLEELKNKISPFRQIRIIAVHAVLLFGTYLLYTSGESTMSFAQFNTDKLRLGTLLVVGALFVIYRKRIFLKKRRL